MCALGSQLLLRPLGGAEVRTIIWINSNYPSQGDEFVTELILVQGDSSTYADSAWQPLPSYDAGSWAGAGGEEVLDEL